MNRVKQFAFPAGMALAIAMILVGVYREYGHLVLSGVSPPTKAMIVYESSFSTIPAKEMVEVYAKAPDFGVGVLDKDTLGKGKQPSAELQPFLDAAKEHELPVLALRWSSGKITVQPCPGTLDELRKVVGQ